MKRAIHLLAAIFLAAAAWAAQQTGPMEAPSNPPVIKRIPLYAKVPPPPMTPGQIIAHFTANEAAYKTAYAKYSYMQVVRVEELDPQGGVTGSFQIQAAIGPETNGARTVRVLGRSQSSLQVLSLSSEDLETILEFPAFPLAGDAAADYNFTYRGTEKQGELMTYAFEVQPKIEQPGRLYFSGVVWIDNVDLAIVMSYGHFVMSGPKPRHVLPFTFFETYRENVEGKYWFPSYLRSDDVYQRGSNQLPIRLVEQSSDFRVGPPQNSPPKTQ
jgi:hypothetical protein